MTIVTYQIHDTWIHNQFLGFDELEFNEIENHLNELNLCCQFLECRNWDWWRGGMLPSMLYTTINEEHTKVELAVYSLYK